MKGDTTLRIARSTDNLATIVAMCEKGLGFVVRNKRHFDHLPSAALI